MTATFLANEQATKDFAKRFAIEQLKGGQVIYLQGPLGAGKTTFVRALLRALGFAGSVKSPTYTLLETYPFDDITIVHMDLYRLKDPNELEFFGLDEYLHDPNSVLLVEWPEQGQGFLPEPTMIFEFDIVDDARKLIQKYCSLSKPN